VSPVRIKMLSRLNNPIQAYFFVHQYFQVKQSKPILLLSLVALLLWQPETCLAQELSDIRFELLDEEDGLSNHLIQNRIVQDAAGFVWISTSDGLNRFDGNSFKVFRHKEGDPNSLQDDLGQSLFVDFKGRLWAGYTEGRISLFKEDCQCFQNFKIQDKELSLPGDFMISILDVEEDGSICFTVRGVGLNVFQPKTGKLLRYRLPNIHPGYPEELQLAYNVIICVYESADGLLWLGTANGLYSFDRKSTQFTYRPLALVDPAKPRSDYFNKIVPDGDRGLWLSAWGGGISYYDLKKGRFKTYKYQEQDLHSSMGNIVYDLLNKNDQEFWVATGDRGLGVFNKETGQFRFAESIPTTANEPLPLGIYQILPTADSVMFFVNNSGLLKYNPNARLFHFRSLPITSSQNGDEFSITKVLEDPEFHAIYFATDLGNGLNVMDTRTGKVKAHPVDIHPAAMDKFMIVSDLLLDNADRLWVMSRDYLYEYDKIREKLLKIEDPFLVKEYQGLVNFKSLNQDPDGHIWVITEQGGLHEFFPNERKLSRALNAGSTTTKEPDLVDRVSWDKYGRMWLAGKGQICIYDPKNKQFLWPLPVEAQALSVGSIRGMATDYAGNIWIAIHRKGLVKIEVQEFAKPVVRLITEADGLPSTRIPNMNTDHEGNIWMSTLLGVVYMDTKTHAFRVFNQTVGMDKNTSYMRFSKGAGESFYITTPGRYCKVNFKVLKRKVPLPRVYIDKFSVYNKEQTGRLAQQSTLTLYPGEDFFSFDFGCLDFTNQALNKFAYMLEGWDKDWVQGGARRYASYTNLNGGSYVFKVKVANSEGIWSEPVVVPVFIETPFYQRSWFAVLVALVFSGLIYALYLYRIRQIEHTERLKTEFNRQLAETRLEALRAQMNPHFIFNCLNSINRYIIKSDIKTSSLYLTRFAKLIRLILDNSEHKKVVLSNELEALKLYIEMEALRFDHKFSFEVEVDPSVDTDNIEIPPLIIQPYVENAIWHGLLHKEAGGHLAVKVSKLDEMLICEISDNGIGREKAKAYKSQNAPTRKSVGMKLTEERLNIAGEGFGQAGSQKIIDLYDDQGQPCGTKVVLTIPF